MKPVEENPYHTQGSLGGYCSLFIKERMDFLETVNIYLPVNNNYATNEHKVVAIMSCDEKCVTDALGKFIYTCLNKRNTCTAITIK